jgi:hypothetical protein
MIVLAPAGTLIYRSCSPAIWLAVKSKTLVLDAPVNVTVPLPTRTVPPVVEVPAQALLCVVKSLFIVPNAGKRASFCTRQFGLHPGVRRVAESVPP